MNPASRRRLQRAGTAVIALAAGPATLLVLAGFLQNRAWWLDLLSHARPQLAVALTLAAFAQILCRPRWPAGAWAAAAVLAAAPVAAYLPTASSRPGALRVAHANLDQGKVTPEAVAAWAARERPGVLFLQEVLPNRLAKLEAALDGYELLAAEPRWDTRGVAAFARVPAEGSVVRLSADTKGRPMAQVTLGVAGQTVSLLSFHAARPTTGELYGYQSQEYAAAATWADAVRRLGAEPVVVGDFNATDQGSLVRRLRSRADLRSARRGRGLAGTWPASLPAPLRVRIDGLLHGRGLTTTDFRLGPDLGGDHRPIVADLDAANPAANPAATPSGAAGGRVR